ncbi:MAG: SdiA-regulated domain-containing protein [Chitinophagales bacterium]|nr:SdiA-regulated domain-containing protein [Chitinophagales bacterium]MDW8418066.1 SdiA-regulated domain-containing protein [Chitinophagales bacterium]
MCAILLCSHRTDILHVTYKKHIPIPEPSDICYSPSTQSYFIVSDKGVLYEVDTNLRFVRKADLAGYDFEGVYADSNKVYVCDETMRRVFALNVRTLQQEEVRPVPYHGGRNLGYESITWNPARNCFVMAIEKDPTRLVEFDRQFVQLREVNLKNKGDISSLTYYNNFIYALSDEKRVVYRLHPETYRIEATYTLRGILNPEGLCFTNQGEMLVLSDDLQMIFRYNLNP